MPNKLNCQSERGADVGLGLHAVSYPHSVRTARRPGTARSDLGEHAKGDSFRMRLRAAYKRETLGQIRDEMVGLSEQPIFSEQQMPEPTNDLVVRLRSLVTME